MGVLARPTSSFIQRRPIGSFLHRCPIGFFIHRRAGMPAPQERMNDFNSIRQKKTEALLHVSGISYAIKPSSNAVFRRVQAFEFCFLILLPSALSSLVWLFCRLPDTARTMTAHLLVRH